jgi:hypothetical protein
MKRLITSLFLLINFTVAYSGTFTLDGNFEGCEYGKIYPLSGGGLLECREYKYFYEFSPEVRTDGREVITIGNEKVQAYILDGSVLKTKVTDTFEGCDFDKRIELENGLVFVCRSYGYAYAYRPEVLIVNAAGRPPEVYIKGKKYNGTLYRK